MRFLAFSASHLHVQIFGYILVWRFPMVYVVRIHIRSTYRASDGARIYATGAAVVQLIAPIAPASDRDHCNPHSVWEQPL